MRLTQGDDAVMVALAALRFDGRPFADDRPAPRAARPVSIRTHLCDPSTGRRRTLTPQIAIGPVKRHLTDIGTSVATCATLGWPMRALTDNSENDGVVRGLSRVTLRSA